MPGYSEHILQAKNNLRFLEQTNLTHKDNYWDWKVTVSFYACVHLVNAHLAEGTNLHYRKHSEVENAINFANTTSLKAVPKDVYLAYRKLKGLSRRSRYLISDDVENKSETVHITYDKHFSRAIKNLNILLKYICDTYKESIPKYKVNCIEIRSDFEYFTNEYGKPVV